MTKGILLKFCSLVCLSLTLTACGSPEEFLSGIIEDKGYIPYNTPMASTGVGTILKGSPQALNVAAFPQTCFPDFMDGQFTRLRWLSETDLPHLNKKVNFSFGAELSSLMILGTPLASLNLGFKNAKKVELEFEGAAIEMLDQVRLFDHYNRTTDTCRLFMENYPIITQALRVNKMKFTFYTDRGVKIGLAPGMIGDIVNIGLGVDWSIENNYTLTINTPKYIGYQVSQMGSADTNGALLRYHAHKLNRKGDWDWQSTLPGMSIKSFSTQMKGIKPSEPLPGFPIGVDLM